MQKNNVVKIRKLPLPLDIRLGNEPMITDGLFSLTGKDASSIKILSVDTEGYATCEIYPPKPQSKDERPNLRDFLGLGTIIGVSASKSRGQSKEYGKYTYYKTPDGTYAAETAGARKRTFNLGKITDMESTMGIYGRTIIRSFGKTEFPKKDLMQKLSRTLSYGQTVKSVLDIMTKEGYLERREATKEGKVGRLREWYKATDKLTKTIVVSPEPS